MFFLLLGLILLLNLFNMDYDCIYKFSFGPGMALKVYCDNLEEAHQIIARTFGERFLKNHILNNSEVQIEILDFTKFF